MAKIINLIILNKIIKNKGFVGAPHFYQNYPNIAVGIIQNELSLTTKNKSK